MYTVKESCHKKITLLSVPSDTAKKLYYYVQWTGHFICKPDFYIDRCNLESFELLYTLKGSGTLKYENETYKLVKDTVMLIDCTKPHQYYPDGDNWEFKYIHFNGSLAKQYYNHISQLHGSPVTSEDDIEKYFIRVFDIILNSGAEEICSDMIYRILTKLIYNANKEKYETTSAARLKNALYYISENYNKHIDVSDLAATAHMSRCYFSTAFKAHTGFSPHQYITNYRINAAKRLLHTTSKTIEEISSDCGFSDSSSFIRTFKRLENTSPFVYRKSKTK